MVAFLETDVTEPDYRPETAWLEHGPFAMWLVRKMRPRRFVELGTHWGYSYFAVCEAVAGDGLETRCTAVDRWTGDVHSGPYDETVFRAVCRQNERYAGFSTLLRKSFDEALHDVEDGSVDLLHIDGRHFYEDVRHDYESWRPKLTDNAVVLFHDTEMRERDFGVHRFWAELSAAHPAFNFLHGHGLGVLFPGGSVPEQLRQVVDLSRADGGPGAVEDFFRLAGSAMTERGRARQRRGELENTIAGLERNFRAGGGRPAPAEAEIDRKLRAAREKQRETRAELDRRSAEMVEARARAEGEVAEAIELALRVADKAARAERRPLRTLFRRLGYGLAKGLLRIPAVERRLGPPLRKALAKHGPRRYHAMVAEVTGVSLAARPKAVLTFTPEPRAAEAPGIATDLGRYGLAQAGPGYTYVPPAPPPDLAARIEALGTRPKFTVVMPTYNTPPPLLRKAVASLEAQWYPTWELLVVDDCSPDAETGRALDALADDRITLVRRTENGGISAATNTAIEQVTGDYVVFLDHDDELTPDCLWELAREIDRSGADFVYSDEDKIDPDGAFVQPFFKPDWSPDALMSTMYTCHVSCVRTGLLRAAGPLNPDYDGAQDWDLILRVTEKAQRISHIPKVLYHWRIIPGSTAGSRDAKPKATDRARRLREEALTRRGHRGRLEEVENLPFAHRVRYEPRADTRLSVIIPTRDNGALVETCIRSILDAAAWTNIEFVVVDNGSTDAKTLEILEALPTLAEVKVHRHDHPFNYAELNNIGLGLADGDVILHLNDDTELDRPDAIERMMGYCQLSHVGAVSARLLYPGGGVIQHAGIVNLRDGPLHAFLDAPDGQTYYYLRNDLEYDWLAVTGACLMVERRKLEEVGGWNASFPVAYNDVDLCIRLHKAGYHNVVAQAARFIHHESLSRGKDQDTASKRERLRRDLDRLYETHPDFYMHDPYFNVNLHPAGTRFELVSGQLVG